MWYLFFIIICALLAISRLVNNSGFQLWVKSGYSNVVNLVRIHVAKIDPEKPRKVRKIARTIYPFLIVIITIALFVSVLVMVDSGKTGDDFEPIFTGLFLIGFGLTATTFPGQLSREAIRWQEETWGFKFSPLEYRSTKIMYAVVGLFFILSGILSLLGLIKYR